MSFKGITALDWKKHVNYLSEHKTRNRYIIEYLKQISNMKNKSFKETRLTKLFAEIEPDRCHHKTTAIVERIDKHLKIMTEALKEENISTDYLDKQKKTYNECSVLWGSYICAGIALDSENACKNYDGLPTNHLHQVISTPSDYKIIQQVGRPCRSKLAIMTIMVDDCKKSKVHAQIAIDTLSKFKDFKMYEFKGNPFDNE
jgi:hypothetical protein